jgi:hypothetical protein
VKNGKCKSQTSNTNIDKYPSWKHLSWFIGIVMHRLIISYWIGEGSDVIMAKYEKKKY